MSIVLKIVNEAASSWQTVVLAALAVYIVSSFLTTIYLTKKFKAQAVPHVYSDNFWGFRVWRTLREKQALGDILYWTKGRFEDMGDNVKTAIFYLLGQLIVQTKDPENIKAILATQFNDFSLGFRHGQFFPLLGDGIFTLDGEDWKHSRAMLRPQFAREQIGHVKLLEPHFKMLAKHVAKSRGQIFDIQELFFRLTVDYATEFLFDQTVGTLDDGTVESSGAVKSIEYEGKKNFAESFNFSQNYLVLRALMSKLYPLLNSKEFQDSNAKVHAFADTYVKYALSLSESELEEKSKGGYIFLYELAKQTRNPKVIRDQLLNILLAGRDTTAGLLSFTFLELSRNPEVLAKLKEEIYTKFGEGDEARVDDITFESLKKCEYLKAVINEALRMYPSVPQNFRVATRDTTLPRGGGSDGTAPLLVRKGQNVMYSVFCTHRDQSSYGKDADSFRPERWFEEKCRKIGWAYVPFNGGPRICLGQQFALTEVSYVVARMLQMFPNVTNDGTQEYPPKLCSDLTISCKGGVNIAVY